MSVLTLKDVYSGTGFLSPYQADAGDFAELIPIIDTYILSNYYNIEVDNFKYLSFLPFFLKAHYHEFNRIYNAVNAEYNPIENYSMTETMNKTRESEETTTERTMSGEKINTNVESGELVVVNENSESTIDTDNLKLSDTSTTTTTPNDYTRTNTESYNNYKNTETVTHETPETENYTLTRSGNIGVTTSQQMILSQFELEKYHKFFAYVAHCFINDLTKGVYVYD